MIEELYQEYAKDIYYYIYSLCKNQTLSEDLTSETFYQVMLSLHSFQGKSNMKTWLFSIARNTTYKELRKRKIEICMEELPEFGKEQSSSFTKDIIEGYIKTLPDVNQRIFMMRMDGYSYDEIGQTLQMNPNSVRVMQHRNRKYLKESLERSEEG